MFIVALGVWFVVFVSGIVMSLWRSAGSSRAERFVAPMYWVAVVAAGVVGVAPLVATGVEQERGPTGFSVDKALAHIDRIAEQPHPIGSAANQDVRDYVADELRGLGLEPEFQTVRVTCATTATSGTVAVVNVMARIAGTASNRSGGGRRTPRHGS